MLVDWLYIFEVDNSSKAATAAAADDDATIIHLPRMSNRRRFMLTNLLKIYTKKNSFYFILSLVYIF